jgi:hypothetical protein
MNETRTRARVVVDTRFADLPNGLFDNCKIAVLTLGICLIELDIAPTRRVRKDHMSWESLDLPRTVSLPFDPPQGREGLERSNRRRV